eukprot:gene33894-42516_t
MGADRKAAQSPSVSEGFHGVNWGATLRFPCGALLVGYVLYAGTSPAWLLFRWSSVDGGQAFVGIAGFVLVTFAAPVLLWWKVLRVVHHRAVFREKGGARSPPRRLERPARPSASPCKDTPPPSAVGDHTTADSRQPSAQWGWEGGRPTQLRVWVMGKGDWVSKEDKPPHGMWFESWGGFFKPYRPGRTTVGVLHRVADAAVVGALQAVPRSGCAACAAVDAATAATLLLSAASGWRLREHARPRDDAAFVALPLLQGAAMAARAAAHARCAPAPLATAVLLLLCPLVLLLKVAADLAVL